MKTYLLIIIQENFVPSDALSQFYCQDFGIALDQLKPLIKLVDQDTNIYPIWLCPTRHVIKNDLQKFSMFRNVNVTDVDVGVYG